MASNNPSGSNAIAGAVPLPAGNANVQLLPLGEQPRQPRNFQGLLRFALDATKAEDAPGNSQQGPMDEERRRFLEEALNDNTVRVDEILKKNIETLTNSRVIGRIGSEAQLPEDILMAFQELGEYIDDIDIANDFEKMGGFSIFPLCYSVENADLRRWANLTLALVCQNNPRCQERALRGGLLPVLLYILRQAQFGDRTLRAISSIVRNYEPAVQSFIAHGGCEVLAIVLRSGEHCELASACFFVDYLCKNNKEAREIFMKTDIIPVLVESMRRGRTDASEYTLSILVTLLETTPEVISYYRYPGMNLRRTLELHLRHPEVRCGRFVEEKEYCERLLRLVFNNPPPKQRRFDAEVEPADR